MVWNVLHADRWNTGRKPKNRHMGTIAQICRTISSQLRHVSTIRNKIVKQQYLLHVSETISAASRPKFTVLWGDVEEVLLLNKFFPIVDTCLSCEDIARQSCAMVPRWRFFASFLRPVFSPSHMQYISDLHSKFALRPHHVWKYDRHTISDHWD